MLKVQGNIHPIPQVFVALHDWLRFGGKSRNAGGVPDLPLGFAIADRMPMVMPMYNTQSGNQQLWAIYNQSELRWYVFDLNAPGDWGAATGHKNFINNKDIDIDPKRPEDWLNKTPMESMITGGAIGQVLERGNQTTRINAFGNNVSPAILGNPAINYWTDPRIQLATVIGREGGVYKLNGDHNVFYLLKTAGATKKNENGDPMSVEGAYMRNTDIAVLPPVPYKVVSMYEGVRLRDKPSVDEGNIIGRLNKNEDIQVDAQYRIGGDLWGYNEHQGFFALLHMTRPDTNAKVQPFQLVRWFVEDTTDYFIEWAKFLQNQYAIRPTFEGERGAFHKKQYEQIVWPTHQVTGDTPIPEPEPQPEPDVIPYTNRMHINDNLRAFGWARYWLNIIKAQNTAIANNRDALYSGKLLYQIRPLLGDALTDKLSVQVNKTIAKLLASLPADGPKVFEPGYPNAQAMREDQSAGQPRVRLHQHKGNNAAGRPIMFPATKGNDPQIWIEEGALIEVGDPVLADGGDHYYYPLITVELMSGLVKYLGDNEPQSTMGSELIGLYIRADRLQ